MPANSVYFEDPCMRKEAAEGLWPHDYSIAPKVVLYRFVDTRHCDEKQAANGKWWFEYDHFQTIKQWAERNGYPLGYAARLFGAVRYEDCPEINGFVRCRTKVGLSAWKGKGKQVIPKIGTDARDLIAVPHGFLTEATPRVEAKMTPMNGGSEVLQVFIPGLGRKYSNFDVFFEFLSHDKIEVE